ncbi:S-layer homology domain-containing protein [Oceanobacillus limi]|uniref:S-layer homology domain-containing protein n=1 Tax=Oceanobacillus limi TaxID=930131 RepID=A0A1I0A3E7_9BACI|nr:right-handed parallel beta-helix repeat-containing protein [Oceanobacillus limi]SES88229.1 S-layer homology domain-containing protein [Oceanobacillus limi]
MQKRNLLIFVVATLFFGLITSVHLTTTEAAGKPTYTITPNSKTYNGNFTNYSTYNSKTKHYYLIRSYLEQLEETGGGTLVLKKGTYTVTNVLYVPSNVTIKLQDGVKLVKGSDSGTDQFNASKSLFQFVAPSVSKKEGIYGGYNGEKNISIIGYGSATIDLKYIKNSLAIIAGHNQNITIKNIRFQNMYSGHFIEMDATKNAVISNNEFIGSKPSSKKNKEAINLDTPDKATNGWSQKWSTYDRTPNSDVTIENNTFYDLDRAIGTHKYSGGKYHDQIVIKYNKIEKMRMDPIRVMNWSNAIIENNRFKDVDPSSGNNNRGILVSGATNPMFQKNVFINIPRAMQFMAWKNSGPGSEYETTYNELSQKNLEALSTNTVVDYVEDFIRINHVYNKYDKANTDYIDVTTSNFSDVSAQNSHYDGIIYWSEKNVINGFPGKDGIKEFKSYDNLSRSHTAVMFSRALNLPVPQDVDSILTNFDDISEDHPYADEIAASYAEEIFKGNNGQFMDDRSLTREQMATVLVKAYNLQDNGDNVAMDMEGVDPSHQENVQIIANLEITNQLTNFRPADPVTRGQFATFLYRAEQATNQ